MSQDQDLGVVERHHGYHQVVEVDHQVCRLANHQAVAGDIQEDHQEMAPLVPWEVHQGRQVEGRPDHQVAVGHQGHQADRRVVEVAECRPHITHQEDHQVVEAVECHLPTMRHHIMADIMGQARRSP